MLIDDKIAFVSTIASPHCDKAGTDTYNAAHGWSHTKEDKTKPGIMPHAASAQSCNLFLLTRIVYVVLKESLGGQSPKHSSNRAVYLISGCQEARLWVLQQTCAIQCMLPSYHVDHSAPVSTANSSSAGPD